MKYPLVMGCTLERYHEIGIDAVVNARGGEQWRNNVSLEEIEMQRDAKAIKDGLSSRVRFYNVYSKFFNRHRCRIEHLISEKEEP